MQWNSILFEWQPMTLLTTATISVLFAHIPTTMMIAGDFQRDDVDDLAMSDAIPSPSSAAATTAESAAVSLSPSTLP
jgi:hypothetical protein